MTNQLSKTKVLTRVFFSITLILIVAESFNLRTITLVCKPLLVPTICALYVASQDRYCTWYFVALLFAFLSNVFLLFSHADLLLYGMIAFLIYKIATIAVAIKNGDKIFLLPFTLATIPFLSLFLFLSSLVIKTENPLFYVTVVNALIISIFCGIGLSAYVLNDDLKNSWLIINTLLSTFQVIIFMFDKFYLAFDVFKPLSVFFLAFVQYSLYRFMTVNRT